MNEVGKKIRVVVVDIVPDRLFQLSNALERSIADAVLRDVAEPPFDHVQP
jgi:hypothetical protein